MKKLYSIITILAMMVAALSLTACGGDDDENGVDGGGSSTSSTFTIIYDDGGEQVFTYDSDIDIDIQSLGANFGNLKRGDSPRGSYFGMGIGTKGDFFIIFPRQKYGEDLDPSYFSVGYSDFGADATDMERVIGLSGWYGEHISGSAKVTKNDGKYITIDFNNYKYSVTSGINTNRTAYVTLKGSLAFKNLYKQ